MDQGALVTPMLQAGEQLISEFNKYKPVTVAYWLRSGGDEDWYLYISSDQINDANFDQAYGEVLRIARAVRNPWLDPFRVKVVGADDRVARAIADYAKQYPGQSPIIMHSA